MRFEFVVPNKMCMCMIMHFLELFRQQYGGRTFAWGLGGVACCGGGGGRTIYNITLHCTATLEFMVGKKLDELDPLMTDRPPDPRVQAHKCV